MAKEGMSRTGRGIRRRIGFEVVLLGVLYLSGSVLGADDGAALTNTPAQEATTTTTSTQDANSATTTFVTILTIDSTTTSSMITSTTYSTSMSFTTTSIGDCASTTTSSTKISTTTSSTAYPVPSPPPTFPGPYCARFNRCYNFNQVDGGKFTNLGSDGRAFDMLFGSSAFRNVTGYEGKATGYTTPLPCISIGKKRWSPAGGDHAYGLNISRTQVAGYSIRIRMLNLSKVGGYTITFVLMDWFTNSASEFLWVLDSNQTRCFHLLAINPVQGGEGKAFSFPNPSGCINDTNWHILQFNIHGNGSVTGKFDNQTYRLVSQIGPFPKYGSVKHNSNGHMLWSDDPIPKTVYFDDEVVVIGRTFTDEEMIMLASNASAYYDNPSGTSTTTLTTTSSEPQTTIRGQADIDGDGRADYVDLMILAGSYGKSSGQTGYDSRADLNGDGKIDYADLIILSGNYGR